MVEGTEVLKLVNLYTEPIPEVTEPRSNAYQPEN